MKEEPVDYSIIVAETVKKYLTLHKNKNNIYGKYLLEIK